MKITFTLSGNVRSNFSYRALALARTLRASGYEVSFIAPKADKYNNFIPEHVTDIDGIKIIQPFQFKTKHLVLNLLPYILGATYQVLKERPDVVYIYKPTPISVVGLFAKFFYKSEIVLDMDDLGSGVMKIEGHPWYQRKLVEWSEQLAARYADRIVAASTYLADIYKEQFPKKPIHIMPNGVEASWLTSPVIEATISKNIVFLGSINSTDILEPLFKVLPDVLQKHPETKVVIIGDGHFLPYFKEKAKELHINESVQFTGWLDIDTAKLRLNSGDIGYCYMPDEITTRAASNMKVPQYMARGVVPLVSEVGDLPATVDFGKVGYIAMPGNVESLRTTLSLALEDKDRIVKVKLGYEFVSARLNWDKLGMNFIQFLTGQTKNQKKKIFFVATTVPSDLGGAEIRNFNLVKQLLKQPNFDVEVFAITTGQPEVEKKKFESTLNIPCHLVQDQSRSVFTMARALSLEHLPPFMTERKLSGVGDVFRKACEKSMPDVVHIEQLDGYYCIRPHIQWLKRKGVKIVFDCHNIEYESFDDSLALFSVPMQFIGKMLVPRMRTLEIEAAKQSDCLFACSASNVDFFKVYNSKTYLFPNGVDSAAFKHTETSVNQTVIFMGGIKYPPNADALQFYFSDIHAKIIESVPNMQLLVIGADEKWLSSIGVTDSSVRPLGFVEDVRPYLNTATVGICPIRYGSGTRIKIMTYMAAGLGVVSTRKGAEGVDYVDGRDVLLRDEANEFADAVIKLLRDEQYRQEIAKNGNNFIEKRYDWNVLGEEFRSAYENLLNI